MKNAAKGKGCPRAALKGAFEVILYPLKHFLGTQNLPLLLVKLVKATQAPNCPDTCHAPTCQPQKTRPGQGRAHLIMLFRPRSLCPWRWPLCVVGFLPC